MDKSWEKSKYSPSGWVYPPFDNKDSYKFNSSDENCNKSENNNEYDKFREKMDDDQSIITDNNNYDSIIFSSPSTIVQEIIDDNENINIDDYQKINNSIIFSPTSPSIINKSNEFIQIQTNKSPEQEVKELYERHEKYQSLMKRYYQTENNIIIKLNKIFEAYPDLKSKYSNINQKNFNMSINNENSETKEVIKIINNIIFKISSKYTDSEKDYILSSDKVKDKIIFISNLISQMTNENEEFQHLNEEAKNKIEDYQKENNNYKIENQKLQDRITQLITENKNLNQKFKAKNLSLKENQIKLENYIIKRENDIKQKHHKLLIKVKSMNDIKINMKKKNKKKIKENKELRNTLKNISKENKELTNQLKYKNKEIDVLQLSISNFKEEKQMLNKALKKEVGEKKKIEKMSLSQKKSIINLTQNIEAQKDEIKEKEDEIKEKEDEIKEKEDEIKEKEYEIKEKEDEKKYLQEKNKELLERLSNVKEESKVKDDMKNDLLEKIDTLTKNNEEKDDKIISLLKEKKEIYKAHKSEIEEKNNEIEILKRKSNAIKIDEITLPINEEEEKEDNTEKETDSINLEIHEKLLKEEEEENTDEILKIKFNYVKKNINEISKILNSKKEKNLEDTSNLNILIPLIENFSDIIPKFQNQLEKKCSLIYSYLCYYESPNDEINYYNNNDSHKMVQLSCGHYCHEECLNLHISVNYPTVEEISHDLEILCPACNKNVKINS